MAEQRIVYGMEVSLRLRGALVANTNSTSATGVSATSAAFPSNTLGSNTLAQPTATSSNATAFLYSPGPADPRLLVKRWDDPKRPQSNFDLCVFRIEPAAAALDMRRDSSVTFGAVIHLVHNFSGRYLSVVRQPAENAVNPANHFQLQLLTKEEAGRACRLRLTSRYKRRAEGDPVVNKDVCYLQYETGQLGLNADVLCESLEDAEATAAEEMTPFDICVYDNTDPNDDTRQSLLRAGIAVLIFHREKDALLITEGKSMSLAQEHERNHFGGVGGGDAGGGGIHMISGGGGTTSDRYRSGASSYYGGHTNAGGGGGNAFGGTAGGGAISVGGGTFGGPRFGDGVGIQNPTISSEHYRRSSSRKARLVCDDSTRTLCLPDMPFFRRFESPVTNLDPDLIEFDCSALWFIDLIDPTVGGPIRTGRQCRLRHGATNQYLYVVSTATSATTYLSGNSNPTIVASGTNHWTTAGTSGSQKLGNVGISGTFSSNSSRAGSLSGAVGGLDTAGVDTHHTLEHKISLSPLDLSVHISNTIFELELVSSDDALMNNSQVLNGKPIFSSKSYLRVRHTATGMYLATAPLGTHSLAITLTSEPTMEDTLAVVVVPRARQANLTFLMGNASFLNAYKKIFRMMQKSTSHYHYESIEVKKVIERTKASLQSLIKFCTESDCEDALKREGIPTPSHQNSLFEVQIHKLALEVCVAPFVSEHALDPYQTPLRGGAIPFAKINEPQYAQVHEICCLVFRLLKQMSKESIYAAQLLDYFDFMQKMEGYKFRIADTLMEIVANNRAMLRSEERCRKDIDHNIELLKSKERSSGYVKYLSLMCVCNERGMLNNQRYICRQLFDNNRGEILLTIQLGKVPKRQGRDAASTKIMNELWSSVLGINAEDWDPTLRIFVPPAKSKSKDGQPAPAAKPSLSVEDQWMTIDAFLKEESEKKSGGGSGGVEDGGGGGGEKDKKAADSRRKMVKFFASSIELMANLCVGLDPECHHKISKYLSVECIIVALDPSIPYNDAIRANFYNVAHNLIVRRALNDIGRDSHQRHTCGDLVIVETSRGMGDFSVPQHTNDNTNNNSSPAALASPSGVLSSPYRPFNEMHGNRFGGGEADPTSINSSSGGTDESHPKNPQQSFYSSLSAAPPHNSVGPLGSKADTTSSFSRHYHAYYSQHHSRIRKEDLLAVKRLSLEELSNHTRHERLRGSAKFIEDYNKLLLSLTSIWHSVVIHEAYTEEELTIAVDSVIRVLVIMLEGKKKGDKNKNKNKNKGVSGGGSVAIDVGGSSGMGIKSPTDKNGSVADPSEKDGKGGEAAENTEKVKRDGGKSSSDGTLAATSTATKNAHNSIDSNTVLVVVKTTEDNIEMLKTKITLVHFLTAVLKHELSRIADTVMHLWAKEGLSADPTVPETPTTSAVPSYSSFNSTTTSSSSSTTLAGSSAAGSGSSTTSSTKASKAAAFAKAQEELRALRENRLQEEKLFRVLFGLTCHEDQQLVNAALELGTLLCNSGAYLSERIKNAEPIDTQMAAELFPYIATMTSKIKKHISPSGVVVNEEPVKQAIESVLQQAETRLQLSSAAANESSECGNMKHPAGIIRRKRSSKVGGGALTRGERPLIARAWGGQLPYDLVEYSRLLGRSGMPEILINSLVEVNIQSQEYVELLLDFFNFLLISDETAKRLGPYVDVFCSLLDNERTRNDAVMIVLAVLRCNKAAARNLSHDNIRILVAKIQSDQSGAISQGLEYITLGQYPIPQNQRQVLSSILSSDMIKSAKLAGAGLGGGKEHEYVLHRSVINLIACCCVNNSTCRAMVSKEFTAKEIVQIATNEHIPPRHIYPFYKLLASGFLVCENEWTSNAIKAQKEQWAREDWWDLVQKMLKKLPPFFDYKGGQDFAYSPPPPTDGPAAMPAYQVFNYGKKPHTVGGGGTMNSNNSIFFSSGSPSLAPSPSPARADSNDSIGNKDSEANQNDHFEAFCTPLIFEGVIPCLTSFYHNLYSHEIHRQSAARIDVTHVAAKAVEVAEWIIRLFIESVEAASDDTASNNNDNNKKPRDDTDKKSNISASPISSSSNYSGKNGLSSCVANSNNNNCNKSVAAPASFRIPKGYVGAAQNFLQAVYPHVQYQGGGGQGSGVSANSATASPPNSSAVAAGGGVGGMDLNFVNKIPSLIEKLGKIMHGRSSEVIDESDNKSKSTISKKTAPSALETALSNNKKHNRFFSPTDKYRISREDEEEVNRARNEVTKLFIEEWSYNSTKALAPLIYILNDGLMLHQISHSSLRSRQYHQKLINHILSWDFSSEVTIAVLASFRIALERSGNDDHLVEAQNYLNEINMLRVITEISIFQRPEVTHEACNLAIGILEDGNKLVQDSLLHYFLNHDERFFYDVDRMLKIAIEDSEQHRTRVANASYYRGHDSPLRFVNVKDVFRFLQLMCEGHHRGLQEYLHSQRDNLRSCNIVKAVTLFASELTTHTLDNENMKLLLQTLALLIEVCQGPCVVNQVTLVTNGVFAFIAQILMKPQFHIDIDELQRQSDEAEHRKKTSGSGRNKKKRKPASSWFLKHLKSLLGFGKIQSSQDGQDDDDDQNEEDGDDEEEEEADSIRLLLEAKCSAVKLILALFEGGTDGSIPFAMINQLPLTALESLAQSLIGTKMFRDGNDEQVCDLVYDIMITMHILTNSVNPAQQVQTNSNAQHKVMRALRIAHRLLDDNKEQIGLLGRLEIERDEKIERVYFRVPAACSLITDETKNQLFWSIDRSTQGSKLSDFLDKADEVIYDVQWLSDTMSTNWYIKHLARFPLRFWDDCSLGCAYIINILFVFVMVDAEGLLDKETDWMGIEGFIRIFAYTQMFVTSVALILDSVLNFPLILYKQRKELLDSMKKDKKMRGGSAAAGEAASGSSSAGSDGVSLSTAVSSEGGSAVSSSGGGGDYSFSSTAHGADSIDLTVFQKVTACLKRNATLYRLASFLFSLLGFLYSDFFFAFHLLGTIKKSSVLENVVVAVTQNGRSLLLTGLLGCMFVYLFTIIAFVGFRDHFEDNSCESLAGCVLHVLTTGLRQGGGIGDQMTKIPSTDPNYLSRVIFDFLFWAFMIVIFLNILFGIIIDTFAELRDEKSKKEEDMRTRCFVCGIDSYTFDRYGDGFHVHETEEHNLWQYLYFILHLSQKQSTEYNGQESFVAECVKDRDIAFFPNGKCSSLRDVKIHLQAGRGGGGGAADGEPETAVAISPTHANAAASTSALQQQQQQLALSMMVLGQGGGGDHLHGDLSAHQLLLLQQQQQQQRKEAAHSNGLLAPDETVALFGNSSNGFYDDDGPRDLGGFGGSGGGGGDVATMIEQSLLRALQKYDMLHVGSGTQRMIGYGGGFNDNKSAFGGGSGNTTNNSGTPPLGKRTAALLAPMNNKSNNAKSIEELELRFSELHSVFETTKRQNDMLRTMVRTISGHFFEDFRHFLRVVSEAEAILWAEKEKLFVDSIRLSLVRSREYIKTLTVANTRLSSELDGFKARYTALQYEMAQQRELASKQQLSQQQQQQNVYRSSSSTQKHEHQRTPQHSSRGIREKEDNDADASEEEVDSAKNEKEMRGGGEGGERAFARYKNDNDFLVSTPRQTTKVALDLDGRSHGPLLGSAAANNDRFHTNSAAAAVAASLALTPRNTTTNDNVRTITDHQRERGDPRRYSSSDPANRTGGPESSKLAEFVRNSRQYLEQGRLSSSGEPHHKNGSYAADGIYNNTWNASDSPPPSFSGTGAGGVGVESVASAAAFSSSYPLGGAAGGSINDLSNIRRSRGVSPASGVLNHRR